MKAEQRKELETNILADKMGHVVQRVKGSQRRTFFTYFIVIAVVVVGTWFVWSYYKGNRVNSSEQWLKIYDGAINHLDELANKDKDTNPGKAARFQYAWFHYWDFGVKMLAVNPQDSLRSLQTAGELYKALATECKDDPVFEPQALLGRAVVEETLAVQHLDHLKKAKTQYELVIEKYKDSAEAKFAQQRLDQFQKNKKRELEDTYETLNGLLRIPPQFLPPGGVDGLPPLKGKKEE